MKFKSQIMSAEDMDRALKRITHQIAEKNHGCEGVVLLGVKRRGAPLARKLAHMLKEYENVDVPVGELDITLYRDDLSEIQKTPLIKNSELPFSIQEKTVILVDDVIYTGRTVRAALDAVSANGRAAKIQLAVLIDRGHRELPIKADYVGRNIPTSTNEVISVQVEEYDHRECVELFDKN